MLTNDIYFFNVLKNTKLINFSSKIEIFISNWQFIQVWKTAFNETLHNMCISNDQV